MSAPTTEQIDPQPFREWAEKRFIAHKGQTVALGAMARMSKGEFAQSLGLDDRVLDRWLKENVTLDRRAVEDAMHRAGYSIWDAYTEDEIGPDPQPTDRDRGGVPPGTGSKLTDRQVYVLHRFHSERRVTIRSLATQIWKGAGFASRDSAEWSIRRGFQRLDLPVIHHGSKAVGARRCKESNHLGERCGCPPLAGQDVCWSHHPDNRERAREQARRNSPFARVA